MKKISIAIMVLVVALASCKKTPEVNLKYVDVERDLITVGTTTATVQCDYDYIATLKKAYLCYGEGENEDNFSSAEMRVVQNTLYVELTGLRGNTSYNYYYEFHNGFNSMRTALKTFKTEVSTMSVTLPTVVTATVTEITANSAKVGGEVTNDGGAEVTERGICWSTNANPYLSDSHIVAGAGIGAFTAAMSNLEPNTTYHVRAYATNEAGTAYGLDREFVTISGGGSGVPEGAIDGLFSVSPTQKVYFSQGNLQYQASTNIWRFAENQWDFVGNAEFGNVYENGIKCDNSFISSAYDGWIDLFGWGTSGWNCGNTYYCPWDVQPSDGSLYGPPLMNSMTGSYANSDWGYYNAISNGGNTSGQWKTLDRGGWSYVLDQRNTNSGIRYAFAQVRGISGVILLPDNWIANTYGLNNVNMVASFDSNLISDSQWIVLEDAGAVFLPASGFRIGTSVENVGSSGSYWSPYHALGNTAWNMYFYDSYLDTSNSDVCYFGLSVRLVQDANP